MAQWPSLMACIRANISTVLAVFEVCIKAEKGKGLTLTDTHARIRTLAFKCGGLISL